VPLRLLRSSVLRWPDRQRVERAVRSWSLDVAARDPRVRRVGYFASYARGDRGVGTDVDLVILVEAASDAFERRALAYEATWLPVPADVLVYTMAEWDRMSAEGGLPLDGRRRCHPASRALTRQGVAAPQQTARGPPSVCPTRSTRNPCTPASPKGASHGPGVDLAYQTDRQAGATTG
jgi:predicted nucleotidyltransferase